jgi:acetyl esterase
VSIGGDSAGGNFAAVVAQRARDEGPPLVFQLLEIPTTDLSTERPSHGEFDGVMLSRAQLEHFRDTYLGEHGRVDDPAASPLLAADLAGLPPALVITASHDPLRDDGEAYAEALAAAGVPVTVRRMDGHVHGSLSLTLIWEPARAWREEVLAALRSAHGTVAAPASPAGATG